MYRGRNWNLEERVKHKASKKKNWYKKSGSEAVFFVNATPNRSLAKACSDESDVKYLTLKDVRKETIVLMFL